MHKKDDINTAVRMVGHLLEHNGLTGPYAADKEGNWIDSESPQAHRFCMAAACDLVSTKLGIIHSGYAVDVTVAVRECLGVGRLTNRVTLWEGTSFHETTPEERLVIARKLQTCGLPSYTAPDRNSFWWRDYHGSI